MATHIYIYIRVGFVYAMNMKYSWGRVKQVSAMMEVQVSTHIYI
jgi:hypothetical protein